MTTAGIILTTIICTTAFIFFFRLFAAICVSDYEGDKLEKSIGYCFTVFVSVICTACIFAIEMVLIYGLCQTTDNYHTIYSNKMNAKVVFKSSTDDAVFIGGHPIKKTTLDSQGTLTLSKDGVDFKKNIRNVEYAGDVEEGSTVEKIEYSNSVRETELFGVSLMKDEDYSTLKIHLKKAAEKTAKDRKDAKIKKELSSILESSN